MEVRNSVLSHHIEGWFSCGLGEFHEARTEAKVPRWKGGKEMRRALWAPTRVLGVAHWPPSLPLFLQLLMSFPRLDPEHQVPRAPGT